MKSKFSVVRYNHEKKENIQIKNPKKEIIRGKQIYQETVQKTLHFIGST